MWKHISSIGADLVADLRFQRAVERLHSKGPRAVAELLAEIGAERSITTIIENKLTDYTSIDTEALAATGGDTMPPTVLHLVGGQEK